MGKRGLLRTLEGNRVAFWCPGCKSGHFLPIGEGGPPRWTFNDNFTKPTFTPSVLVTWSTPSDNPDEFDDSSKDIPQVCHSFVTNGRIQFLDDCTHALRGRTVDLPEWQQRAVDRESDV